MRFSKCPILPYMVDIPDFQFENIPSLQNGDNLLDETLYTKLFSIINEGEERVFVILRANGLSFKEIGFVTGKNIKYCQSVITRVRKKVETQYHY
jgi:DNA-directed RNA polymerase specialized sigma24 family protein